MTIILLEDELEIAALYQKHFSAAGFEVLHFERATDLLESIPHLKGIQWALLDESIKGDEKKGSDCIESLKAHSPDTKVSILTNFSDPVILEKISQKGADFIELKINIHPKRLAQTILKTLESPK